MALLSTEGSNDSQKRMRAVLTIHLTLAYPSFSLIRPLFLRVLPKGGRICEGLLYLITSNLVSICSAEKHSSRNGDKVYDMAENKHKQLKQSTIVTTNLCYSMITLCFLSVSVV